MPIRPCTTGKVGTRSLLQGVAVGDLFISYFLPLAEILHQLIDRLSQYLQGFRHVMWCRISSINSIIKWDHILDGIKLIKQAWYIIIILRELDDNDSGLFGLVI